MNINDYFNTGYKWLTKLFADFLVELRKDKKDIIEKLNPDVVVDEIRSVNNSISNIPKKIDDVVNAIKNQIPPEAVKITNIGEVNDKLNEVIKTLQEELGKIDKEIVVKNDLSSLATLFKTGNDKKDLLSALKKIENKIKEPDITDYTLILDDLIKAVEAIKFDFNTSNIEKKLDELKVIISLSKPEFPEDLLDNKRVKVLLSDKQIKKITDGLNVSVLTGNGGNNSAVIEKLNEIKTVLENLDVTINAGDIEIGAVEIKDATTDTRAVVGVNGLNVDVKASVLPTGAATETTLNNIYGLSSLIKKYTITDVDDDASPNYYGYVDSAGNWFIMKETVSAGNTTYRFINGTSGYTTNWTNRASLSYDYFNVIF